MARRNVFLRSLVQHRAAQERIQKSRAVERRETLPASQAFEADNEAPAGRWVVAPRFIPPSPLWSCKQLLTHKNSSEAGYQPTRSALARYERFLTLGGCPPKSSRHPTDAGDMRVLELSSCFSGKVAPAQPLETRGVSRHCSHTPSRQGCPPRADRAPARSLGTPRLADAHHAHYSPRTLGTLLATVLLQGDLYCCPSRSSS